MALRHAPLHNISIHRQLREYGIPTLAMMVGMVLSISGFLAVLDDRFDELQKEFNALASVEASNIAYELRDYRKSVGAITYIVSPETNQSEEEDLRLFIDSLVNQMPLDGLWWVTHQQEGENKDVVKRIGGAKDEELEALSLGAVPSLLASLAADNGVQRNDFITEPFAMSVAEPEKNYVALIHPLRHTNQRIKGAVVGVLDYKAAIENTFAWLESKQNANFYLFQSTSAQPELIYRRFNEEKSDQSPETYEQIKRRSPFYFEQTFRFPGREWYMVFTPTRAYVSSSSGWIPWVVLTCGLTISALLGMFLLFQVTRERHIKQQVREQTRELRLLTQDLQEKEGRFRAIVDNSVDGMITISESGRIRSFNPACEKLFGYKAHEVMNQNVSMLMPEPYRSEHDRYIESYRHTGDAKIIGIGREVSARRKNGEVFPIDLSVSKIELPDRVLFSGIIRDISQRKKSESELRDTAEALSTSNAKLEQFAYVASHDLRAPLRAIDNLSLWLEEDLGPKLKGDSKKNLELLRGRVARMDRLLSDLLEYSRIGRIREKEQPLVKATDMFEEIIGTLSVPKGFTVTISEKFNGVELERMPIKQVFYNLINNAIKHHDKEKGRITVSLESKDDELFHFQVSDDGPGIPKTFHKKVFQMFQTLKPRDEVEGSGVGLALVEKIVEQHGGTVTLVSDEGIGTTVLFTWRKPTRKTRDA